MIRRIVILILAVGLTLTMSAQVEQDYKETWEYLALRDSVHHAFNDGDSTRFFTAVDKLEKFLQDKGDLHAYYTQRCNEIVFQLNRQRIFEAYMLATQLSKELTEKKLDKEMYMAVNMMGHIYRYCGDKESAKRCFWEVIRRMEQEGYKESEAPIYMNLVNIIMDENPEEALRLIDQAAAIARESSPERLFDIEARRTLAYYMLGDIPRFLEGYRAYKDGESKGQSSVHGRKLEVYYLVHQGRIDEAVALAGESSDDPYETQADIYSKVGRWQEAFDALKKGAAETDSIYGVLLSSSMKGIQDELRVYEVERKQARMWLYGTLAVATLLLMLVVAFVYISIMRRRHLREMSEAYLRIVESEKMKAEFVQNVSHEVRTPLSIISGFAQVLADPENDLSPEERRHIADTMMHNTDRITIMINEVLEIARGDSVDPNLEMTQLNCNQVFQNMVNEFHKNEKCTDEQLRFDTSLKDDFTILSNEVLLQRIIYPLLDNALKQISFDGLVVMRAFKSGEKLMITVEDNGPGVPANEAEHIFERFVKLDTFKEGLGLGLTFSRTMARRMGGDVRLDTSYENQGARFEVTIPFERN